jgi:L-fuconolactonase
MVIDSHVHLWAEAWGYEVWIRRKIAGIDRDFTVADLRAAGRVADAGGAILVHAAENPAETESLLGLAAAEPFLRGVVGWADVTAPDLARRLDAWQRHPKFRGLRVMPAFGGDAGWLARPDVRQGFAEIARRGLALDLLVGPAQLASVPALWQAIPSLAIMINHCGRPLTATGEVEPWATLLRRIAAETPACCKLSSLAERAGMDWRWETLAPYADVVIEAFGPSRLAFGSNWPVVNIAASYAGWWRALDRILARHALRPADREAIFGATAAAFYRLEPGPPRA